MTTDTTVIYRTLNSSRLVSSSYYYSTCQSCFRNTCVICRQQTTGKEGPLKKIWHMWVFTWNTGRKHELVDFDIQKAPYLEMGVWHHYIMDAECLWQLLRWCSLQWRRTLSFWMLTWRAAPAWLQETKYELDRVHKKSSTFNFIICESIPFICGARVWPLRE